MLLRCKGPAIVGILACSPFEFRCDRASMTYNGRGATSESSVILSIKAELPAFHGSGSYDL
jgi:hypothetical protein